MKDNIFVLPITKKDASNKDVRVSGGSNVIRQYLNAGLIDEFCIHLSTLLIGSATKLFDDSIKEKQKCKLEKVLPSSDVVHLFYSIK